MDCHVYTLYVPSPLSSMKPTERRVRNIASGSPKGSHLP